MSTYVRASGPTGHIRLVPTRVAVTVAVRYMTIQLQEGPQRVLMDRIVRPHALLLLARLLFDRTGHQKDWLMVRNYFNPNQWPLLDVYPQMLTVLRLLRHLHSPNTQVLALILTFCYRRPPTYETRLLVPQPPEPLLQAQHRSPHHHLPPLHFQESQVNLGYLHHRSPRTTTRNPQKSRHTTAS